MKAAVIFGVALCAGLTGWLGVGTAHAAAYIGLDADRYALTLKSSDSELYPQSTAGEDLHVGERWGRFAAELGYGSSTYAGNGNINNLHLLHATIDGIFYVPLFKGLNILVTAGGVDTNYGISTYTRNYYTVNGQNRSSNADVPLIGGSEFDWRGGGGFSFGLDEFEMRVLAHYQPFSMAGQAQNAFSVDLGLNFYL